jgi:hypothetical protein
VPIVSDDTIKQMRNATKDHKSVLLFVNSTNFLRTLRTDVIKHTKQTRSNESSSIVFVEESGK